MNMITELKETLRDYLSPLLAPHATVMIEYPRSAIQKQGCLVCIGTDKISAVAGAETYLGADAQGELYGRALQLDLRFDILSAADSGVCHQVFDRLCSELFAKGCPVRVAELCCGQLTHNRLVGGFVLTATAKLGGFTLHGQAVQPLSEFIVRRVE